MKTLQLAFLAIAFGTGRARAQEPAPAPPPQPALQPRPASDNTQAPGAQNLPAETSEQPKWDPKSLRAWSMLTEFAGDGKSSHDRIEALAALGTMGSDEHAARLIDGAMIAHDPDVRIAAILAAGQTRNPTLTPRLEATLDDRNPEVAYTAAITLWEMHDYAGQDLLVAVAEGDRKTKPGLIKSAKHTASKDLHSPKTLAMIAVNQGSGYFLGPFGVGLKAIEYVNKNSGASTRGEAVDKIAEQHTGEVRAILVDLLDDGEPAVRAAAAKGLGRWPGEETAKQVEPLMHDDKLAVRLTAAAAYIRAANNIAIPPDRACDRQ